MEPVATTATDLGAPGQAYRNRVNDMYHYLESVFAGESQSYRSVYHMFRVGCFGLSLYCEGDELDCLLVGNTHDVRLGELVWQRIAEARTNWVMFTIHYLRAAFDTEGLYPLPGSPPERVENYHASLNKIADYTGRIEKDPSIFVCYHFLRRWAERLGLYGKLGHLNSYKLAELARYVADRLLDTRKGGINDYLFQHNAIGPSQTQADILRLKLSEMYNAVENIPSPMSSLDFQGILERIAGGPFTSRFDCHHYLQISAIYAGPSLIKGNEMMTHIQEWIPRLFNILETHFPELEFRLWPNLLVQASGDERSRNNEWEGYWLIAAPISSDAVGPMMAIVKQWTKIVEKDAKSSYSDSISSLYAVIVPKLSITEQSFVDNTRKWLGPPLELNPDLFPLGRDLTAVRTIRQVAEQVLDDSGNYSVSKSLRPALDVLHRLAYDPAFDLDDYMTGYEDRHAKANYEKPARDWVTDVTSDDFIPQSRIRYFRRISDGVTVWSRQKKLDSIFS